MANEFPDPNDTFEHGNSFEFVFVGIARFFTVGLFFKKGRVAFASRRKTSHFDLVAEAAVLIFDARAPAFNKQKVSLAKAPKHKFERFIDKGCLIECHNALEECLATVSVVNFEN